MPQPTVVDKIREKKYRVLVIDDDDDFREGFSLLLKLKYNMEVDEVSRGRLGIEKLASGNTYDFIFVDMMMPGMSGIETYYELRQIDSEIRVVIVSADPTSKDYRKAGRFKNVALIGKPVSDSALIEIFIPTGDIS